MHLGTFSCQEGYRFQLMQLQNMSKLDICFATFAALQIMLFSAPTMQWPFPPMLEMRPNRPYQSTLTCKDARPCPSICEMCATSTRTMSSKRQVCCKFSEICKLGWEIHAGQACSASCRILYFVLSQFNPLRGPIVSSIIRRNVLLNSVTCQFGFVAAQ